MSDIVEELSGLMYDPMAVQDKVLTILDNANNGIVNIPDPNNPFVYLLETNILPTAAAMADIANSLNKMYPILANTSNDLYSHLTTDDLSDVYATPSKTMFTFYINKNQMITSGNTTNNSSDLMIPRKTTITVNDIQFTTLNDISITMYKDGSVFVKVIGNNDVLATTTNVIIPSGIITDNDNVDWVLFEIEVYQLQLLKLTDSIIKSTKYSKDILIQDQFNHINVSSNNSDLNISYTNFAYDVNTPTVYLKRLVDRVNLEIPYMYTLNNMLGETVDIDVYTTKGNISEPINNYSAQDITLNFNIKGSQDPMVVGLNNISIFCKGNTYTYGGSNEIDFKTLRDKIISRTVGNNTLPITDYDISDMLTEDGYTLTVKSDSMFNREYVVHKYINLRPDFAEPDVFMDTVILDNTSVDNYYVQDKDGYMVINPFTTLQYKDNKLVVLSKAEVDQISLMNNTDTTDYINRNQLFYTIYKYVLDYDDTLVSRVYDVNAPTVTKVYDNTNNPSLPIKFTVLERTMYRVGDLFKIDYTLMGENSDTLNVTMLKAQLSHNHDVSSNKVYYVSDVTLDNGLYKTTITIDTTGYIDKNDMLHIQNNVGDVSLPLVPLLTQADLYIYTTDTAYTNNKTYLLEEIYATEAMCDLYKESLTVTFGKRLEYIYTKYNVDYTNRKYLRYDTDVPLTYNENVYEMDANGVVVNYVDTTGDGVADTAVPVITHLKGDNVLDDNGDIILLHRVNDIIMDDNNTPIIDTVYGMLHTVDILLLEYEYKICTNQLLKEHMVDVYKYITTICTTDLGNLNSTLLENTIMKYKPLPLLSNVNLLVNNIIYNNPNFIRPVVTVYVKDLITDAKVINLLKQTVSTVLQDGLRREDYISDIEKLIRDSVTIDIINVNIANIDIIGDVDIKKYSDNSSRFVIDKQLYIDELSSVNVKLNIDIKILTI